MTGRTYFSIITLCLLVNIFPRLVFCQESNSKTETGPGPEIKNNKSISNDIKYYNGLELDVRGRYHDELNYNRLPLKFETIVRPEVWSLSRNSAGISVRFATNSSIIRVKWSLLNNATLANMAKIGVGGLDLYCLANGKWEYVSSGVPYGKVNESTLIAGMDTTCKEFLLYLPLYDGVDSLGIGIDLNAEIRKAGKTSNPDNKPIVFYGTSITQGGCASRPGMAYTSIISRNLDIEVVNLGFSGNGRLEQSVGQAICEIDASLVVLDCVPNSPADTIRKNALPLIRQIRKCHPQTPVLLVESSVTEASYFRQSDLSKDNRHRKIEEQNTELRRVFDAALGEGMKDIYYLESDGLMGDDYEGTVDGVHPSDLGMLRLAEKIQGSIAEVLKIEKTVHPKK